MTEEQREEIAQGIRDIIYVHLCKKAPYSWDIAWNIMDYLQENVEEFK